MAASKLATDILWYWYYSQKYRDQASLVGKRYVLEVELAKFLTEVTHPPVIKLVEQLIETEKKKLGF